MAGAGRFGASLTMIDRHYGHVARDEREHAIKLLDSYAGADDNGVHPVDVAWTLQRPLVAHSENTSRPATGGRPTPITRTPLIWEQDPAVSPDGRTIVFQLADERSRQTPIADGLFLIGIDGKHLRRGPRPRNSASTSPPRGRPTAAGSHSRATARIGTGRTPRSTSSTPTVPA